MAAIYSNFRTYIVKDEGIEQTDGYTCGPASNKLFLRFERIVENPSYLKVEDVSFLNDA